MAYGPDGNLYVIDSKNRRIRMIEGITNKIEQASLKAAAIAIGHDKPHAVTVTVKLTGWHLIAVGGIRTQERPQLR